MPVVAQISTGSLQLRLDGRLIAATTADIHWESTTGAAAGDYYLLKINSGTVRVTLEEDPTLSTELAPVASAVPPAGVGAALNVVLDGVAARPSSG